MGLKLETEEKTGHEVFKSLDDQYFSFSLYRINLYKIEGYEPTIVNDFEKKSNHNNVGHHVNRPRIVNDFEKKSNHNPRSSQA